MTAATYPHIPVLVAEVLHAFEENRFKTIVDGTLGMGGHTEALLTQQSDRHMIGLEWDPAALKIASERLTPFGDRFKGILGSYADMPRHLKEQAHGPVDGVLLDLGLSSLQLADESRGFSFNASGPFDMRMSPKLPETAWDLIRNRSEEELAELFYRFGEERFSRRVAERLKFALGKGLTDLTEDIAFVIREAIPKGRPQGVDAATRCFQALRIAVNGELSNLDSILDSIRDVLAPGGRVAIISFHSLEDRAVKRAFQKAVYPCDCPPKLPRCACGKLPWGRSITRKPIVASDSETQGNPRARSAKLRILERLPYDR